MLVNFISLLFLTLGTSDLSPEEIVQKQLDTYNERDIDGFMSVMSAGVILVRHEDQEVLAKGWNEVRKIYTDLFKNSPKLHSDLTDRIVLGNKVIDHETITGRLGNSDPIELVVIYEVNNDKIIRITVIRP